MEEGLTLGAGMLFVKDMKRALEFYRDVLGFSVVAGQGDLGEFAVLDAGGPRLVLHRIPDRVARGITIDDPPRRRIEAASKFVLVCRDVAAVREALVARGVVADELQHFREVRFFDASDPEGNVFQVSDRYLGTG